MIQLERGCSGGLQATVHRAKGSKEEDFGRETETMFHWHRPIAVLPWSRTQEALAPFEKETFSSF